MFDGTSALGDCAKADIDASFSVQTTAWPYNWSGLPRCLPPSPPLTPLPPIRPLPFSLPPITPPATPPSPPPLSCGPHTAANADTGQCEIVCATSGRRLSDEPPPESEAGAQQHHLHRHNRHADHDDQAAWAATTRQLVSSYLRDNPDLAAWMDGALLNHVEKLAQLFRPPAPA